MAFRKRPPTHRVDATPVYIHPSDDAWDVERIEREIAEAIEGNKDVPKAARISADEHPVRIYHSGATRCDLDAPIRWMGIESRASEYLRPGSRPCRFVLRRLNYAEMYRVTGMADALESLVLACTLGLADVDGDDVEVDPDRRSRSDEEMQALYDLEPNLPLAIGAAVLHASRRLDDGEKKPAV